MKFSEINPGEPVFKLADGKPIHDVLNEHLFIFDMKVLNVQTTSTGPVKMFVALNAAVGSPTAPREWLFVRLFFESVIKKQIAAVNKEYEKKNLKFKDDPIECTVIDHDLFGVILADPEAAVKEPADEVPGEMPSAEPAPVD